jgi:hypothetical protein
MGGSEAFHGLVDGFDERQHGLFQLALELRFMSLKPLPAVISFQAAQEFEASFTKVRFAGDVWEGGDRHAQNNYRKWMDTRETGWVGMVSYVWAGITGFSP